MIRAVILGLALSCATATPLPAQDGAQALFEAVLNDDSVQVDLLLGMGGNVDARNEEGWTPLMTAVGAQRLEMARRLLDGGADPKLLSRTGMDALRYAGLYGCAECVPLLTAAGADADGQDPSGWSAMFYAVSQGHVEVVRALLAAGATPGVRSETCDTALHVAVARGTVGVLDPLLKAGADPEAENNLGITPLQSAGWRESSEGLRVLQGHMQAGQN